MPLNEVGQSIVLEGLGAVALSRDKPRHSGQEKREKRQADHDAMMPSRNGREAEESAAVANPPRGDGSSYTTSPQRHLPRLRGVIGCHPGQGNTRAPSVDSCIAPGQ
jgi:hypothetical protein